MSSLSPASRRFPARRSASPATSSARPECSGKPRRSKPAAACSAVATAARGFRAPAGAGPRNAATPGGPAVAAVTVLPKRAQKLVGSVEVAEPDERLDRVRYGLDHLQAAPGLRARYVLERSPRLCGVVQRKLGSRSPAVHCGQVLPWIAFAQAMPWAARSRASWTRPRRVASALFAARARPRASDRCARRRRRTPRRARRTAPRAQRPACRSTSARSLDSR